MIVGLSGKAGSGKSTVSRYLKEAYGYEERSFAAPLKALVAEIFGYKWPHLHGPSAHREQPQARFKYDHTWEICRERLFDKGPHIVDEILGYSDIAAFHQLCHVFEKIRHKFPTMSARECLQAIGTEWGRDLVSDTIWIDYLDRNVENGSRVVISDVRFLNELTAVRKKGGITIRLKREVARVGDVFKHASETALDTVPDSAYDYVIENQGSVSDLLLRIAEIMKERQVSVQ